MLLIRGRQHRVQRVETLLAVKELVRPLRRLSHGLLILVTVNDLGGHLIGPAEQQRTHRITGEQRVQQALHPLDIPHLVALHEREMPPIAPHSDTQQLTDRVLTPLVVRCPRDGRHGPRLALLACRLQSRVATRPGLPDVAVAMRKECAMHVVIRSYSGQGASELFDLLGQREEDVKALITWGTWLC